MTFLLIGSAAVVFAALCVVFLRWKRPPVRPRPSPISDRPPSWMLQLAMHGIDCRITDDAPLSKSAVPDAGYAVCIGLRANVGAFCGLCDDSQMRRLGETTYATTRTSNPVFWFAFCCDTCGSVQRYANGGYGFLGIWLGRRGGMFDVMASMEPFASEMGYTLLSMTMKARSAEYAAVAKKLGDQADEYKDVAQHHGDPAERGGKLLPFRRPDAKKKRGPKRPRKW